MPKTFMKVEGKKYIQEKDENNLGIYFFSIKKKSKLKEKKDENWKFIFWLTKNTYLYFMENKIKIEGRRKRIKYNVIYE
jgi:hypothetical protein